MERYNILKNREIVLLKAFPCFWGKCLFCDYIDDNSLNRDKINRVNFSVLDKITGEKGALEVINSGSCFEIPDETLVKIKGIIKDKNIKKLYLESHWNYRNKLQELRDFFQIPIIFKVGVETFDNDFRNNYLNKNAYFKDYKEVKEYFQSVCLMVGIKGQTKESIKRDIDIVINNFDYAAINIYIENSTPVKRDEELIKWFMEEYKFLENMDNIDVLYKNTDFGVGD